jgi:hypothetical protein
MTAKQLQHASQIFLGPSFEGPRIKHAKKAIKAIIGPIISHNIEIPIYVNKYLIAIAIIPINIIIESIRKDALFSLSDAIRELTNATKKTIIKNEKK